MRHWILAACATLAIASAATAQAQVPHAIFTDPPVDAKAPASSEVLHIPSGGVQINGLAYLAAGAGPHPTVVIAHGLPGNEKNLDLAQAIRRSGWNAVTFNYRGSWGSPGTFSFTGNLDDARAVLAYLRTPANAAGARCSSYGCPSTARTRPPSTHAILVLTPPMSQPMTVIRAMYRAGDGRR